MKRIDIAIVIIIAVGFSILWSAYSSHKKSCRSPVPRNITEQTIEVKHLWSKCIQPGASHNKKSVVIYKDDVIAIDYGDGIYSFDVNSGEVNWLLDVEAFQSLLIDEKRDRIYSFRVSGTSRVMYALDVNSGSIIWSNGKDNGKRVGCTPLLLPDDRLVASCSWDDERKDREINIQTGRYDDSFSAAALEVSLYDRNKLFAHGYMWQIRNGILKKLDAISGDVLWQSNSILDDLCCLWWLQTTDKDIYIMLGNNLFALDQNTGEIIWQTSEIVYVVPPVLANGVIYALNMEATLHLYNATDGTIIGTVQFQEPSPEHRRPLFSGESLGSSQIALNNNYIAIFFGDTDTLSVYQIIYNYP